MRNRIIHIIFLSAVLLSFAFIPASGQQIEVKGTVRSAEGSPLSGAVVKVKAGNRIIKFGITSASGSYRLVFSAPQAELSLTCEHLSYNKYTAKITAKSQNIDIRLTEKATRLREVTVKAPKIKVAGDTLSYNLAAFRGKGDVTLEDAMKKLPGIDINTSGAIKYMGKDISKFYIEGLDLLGGKYTLATRNLSAESVTNVEVLNHHHEAKIDKNVHSDDVALNIRLSSKIKMKPVGQSEASVGYGDRFLYQFGTSAMLFTPKFQTITTAKIGNIESFSQNSILDLIGYKDNTTGLFDKAVGGLSASSPPLDGRRYANPQDKMASANFINKLSDDATLKGYIDYAYGKSAYGYDTESRYYNGGNETVIREDQNFTSRTHKPKLSITYNLDKDNKYIKNKFEVSGEFRDNDLVTATQDSVMRQNMNGKTIRLRNSFDWRFKVGKNTFSASSRTSFTTEPPSRFSISYNDSTRLQTGKSYVFKTENSISTRISGTAWWLYLPLEMTSSHERFLSELHTGEAAATNNLFDNYRQFAFKPKYEYTSPNNVFVLDVSLDAKSKTLDVHGTGSKSRSVTKLYLDPGIYFNMSLSPVSTLIINSSIRHDIGDLTDFLTQPILNTWRTSTTRSGILSKQRTISGSMRYEYKRPLSLLFFNADLSYSAMRRNLLSSQLISGSDIISGNAEGENNSGQLTASANISKTFQSIETKVSLSADYSLSNSETMQQGLKIKYEGQGIGSQLEINSRPMSWLEVDYKGSLSKTFSKYRSVSTSYLSTSHVPSISFYPDDKLRITATCDYLRKQLTDGTFKNMTLFDVKLQYKIKPVVIMLSANNLLNTKRYAYTEYDDINRFTYDYALRGREFVLSVRFFK